MVLNEDFFNNTDIVDAEVTSNIPQKSYKFIVGSSKRKIFPETKTMKKKFETILESLSFVSDYEVIEIRENKITWDTHNEPDYYHSDYYIVEFDANVDFKNPYQLIKFVCSICTTFDKVKPQCIIYASEIDSDTYKLTELATNFLLETLDITQSLNNRNDYQYRIAELFYFSKLFFSDNALSEDFQATVTEFLDPYCNTEAKKAINNIVDSVVNKNFKVYSKGFELLYHTKDDAYESVYKNYSSSIVADFKIGHIYLDYRLDADNIIQTAKKNEAEIFISLTNQYTEYDNVITLPLIYNFEDSDTGKRLFNKIRKNKFGSAGRYIYTIILTPTDKKKKKMCLVTYYLGHFKNDYLKNHESVAAITVLAEMKKINKILNFIFDLPDNTINVNQNN